MSTDLYKKMFEENESHKLHILLPLLVLVIVVGAVVVFQVNGVEVVEIVPVKEKKSISQLEKEGLIAIEAGVPKYIDPKKEAESLREIERIYKSRLEIKVASTSKTLKTKK